MNTVISYVIMGLFGFGLASIIYVPAILNANKVNQLKDNYIRSLEKELCNKHCG